MNWKRLRQPRRTVRKWSLQINYLRGRTILDQLNPNVFGRKAALLHVVAGALVVLVAVDATNGNASTVGRHNLGGGTVGFLGFGILAALRSIGLVGFTKPRC